MSKRKNYILPKAAWFLLLLVFLTACSEKSKYTPEELAALPFPQREGLPQVSGGFVLAVENETITADEIITPLTEHFKKLANKTDFKQFETIARPQIQKILTERISNILLYAQAKKKYGDNIDDALEKAAQTEVRKFITSYGGDYAKAEAALKQDNLDWKSFEDLQKKLILSQSYIASKIPEQKTITYNELLDRYNQMRDSFDTPARLTFQLIDIQPAKLNPPDPNKTKLQYANDLADDILEKINSGTDFGDLAKEYSHGHRQMFGGLWKPVQPDSLAKPYDILAQHAENIEPGQIAGPIPTGDHIFIMKLKENKPAGIKPLKDVQKEVEAKIILDRRKKALDQLIEKLLEQAEIGQKDSFIEFCLQKLYLNSQ